MNDLTKLAQAVSILRAGGLVAFPTETVYGLGADAKNEAAVHKIFEAKNRPANHPLIVHIAEIEQLDQWGQFISPAAKRLAQMYWPGPLTMIFKKQPHVLSCVTGGQETVGIRMPRHPLAQALLNAFGGALVAPSANQFTHISPTTAAAVQEELGDSVDLILDGGECEVGLESTILDMSSDTPTILRPGMISAEQITKILGKPVSVIQSAAELRVPGMHHLHYAPTTKTALIASDELEVFLQAIKADDLPLAILRHGPPDGTSWPQGLYVVYLSSDPERYAHDLYRELRALDHGNFKQILIEQVPEQSAWSAIQDRLTKAAGGRILSLNK